jgi:Ca2+:H+ antiporter
VITLSELKRLERGVLATVALLTALAAVARYAHGISQTAAFVLAALALAGQAWVVGFCTEQVGKRSGPAIAGTLQSTVGNLPEFFVVLFALQARDTTVAQTAILGSILVNALLVLGIVLVVGALRAPDGIMRFSPRLPNDTATLTLAASFLIVLLGIVDLSHTSAAHHTRLISIVGAIVLLCVYATWLPRYLRDGAGPAAEEQRAPPRVGLRTSLTLLVAAGIGSAFVSDWFVHALEPTIRAAHISQAFAGIVIVAIAGNAVENFAGVYLAIRGQSDLAIAVVKTSVAQLVAFLYPVLVLVSLLTAGSLTFALAPVYVGALLGTAILVWQITGDGEATPFEGAALIAMYVIVALISVFEH